MKFDLILADPPWKYAKRNKGTKFGLGSNTYDTMSLEDICNIDVQSISNENSMLAIWVTGPYLEKAFKVINAWGFNYITIGFSWVKLNKNNKRLLEKINGVKITKDNINNFLSQIMELALFKGPGNYTMSNCEFCLLAKKGKGLSEGKGKNGLNMTVRNRGVRQVIVSSALMPHSRKPAEARKRLEDLYGIDRSKIELFATENANGWMCIGNQVTGNDINKDIEVIKNINNSEVKYAKLSI